MPRKWYKIILAAGLSAICVLGCSKKTDTKAPTKPVPVTTLAVTPEDVPEWHEVMGQTEGADQVEIRSQVSGILKRQLYRKANSSDAASRFSSSIRHLSRQTSKRPVPRRTRRRLSLSRLTANSPARADSTRSRPYPRKIWMTPKARLRWPVRL